MGQLLDIVLFPHADIHVAMTGAPQLQIKVMLRSYREEPAFPDGEDKNQFALQDVTAACTYAYFAPYEPTGNRLTRFVNINNAGRITPIGTGINFVNITYSTPGGSNYYVVARIQVHQQILGWWFGNSSLTTARDTYCPHSQVSIYALFSDDPKGTDLVGDITGHGYVNLSTSSAAVFELDTDHQGRLWGRSEGTATLSGTFLGSTKTLPVTVFDYAKTRNILDPVQYVKPYREAHNIIFLPEGFRDTTDDRDKFDQIVSKFVDDVFHKPRHQPFGLLQGSFNVFKAFIPSTQHTLTNAYKVNDETVSGLFEGIGNPIPYPNAVSSSIPNPYTVEELVQIVGLPLRNESRTPAQLKTLWAGQFIPNYNASKVDDNLINAWKIQKSLGILETRDTIFGFCLGERYADPRPGFGTITVPANDSAADPNMGPFISRMMQWYQVDAVRTVTTDPRRHSPYLSRYNADNAGNIIMTFINNLQYMYSPHDPIGSEWVPSLNVPVFKNSRGMVVVVCNEGIDGGANNNHLTITANTLNSYGGVKFVYNSTATEKIMRRDPPNIIPHDFDEIIDTVVHELGHSFNLGDEYESFPGDNANAYDGYDNIASLSSISLNSNYLTNRLLDPNKVKWFDLLRIQLSNVTIEDSVADAGRLKVKIDPKYIGRWKVASDQHLQVYVRRRDISTGGAQLPLSYTDDNYAVRLDIVQIEEANGFIFLGGPELPTPLPTYPKGTMIFIPIQDSAHNLVYVVEKKVKNFLLNDSTNKNLPLNKDTDILKVNTGEDSPKSIPDFKAPCKSFKLIGVYEGANYKTGMVYRPTGNCKMRSSRGGGEFCHVCKYLIVNRVDASLHDILDHNYYPTAKKN